MHFGNIVKNVAYSKGLSAEEMSLILKRTVSEILGLYEQKAWTLQNMMAVSVALEHNFITYLENTYRPQSS